MFSLFLAMAVSLPAFDYSADVSALPVDLAGINQMRANGPQSWQTGYPESPVKMSFGFYPNGLTGIPNVTRTITTDQWVWTYWSGPRGLSGVYYTLPNSQFNMGSPNTLQLQEAANHPGWPQTLVITPVPR